MMISHRVSFPARFLLVVIFVSFLGLVSAAPIEGVKKYQFDIQMKNVSRLCHTKAIVTVNGKFPGPTLHVREGQRVIINVTNYAPYNMSIHWHGLKQFRNGWADGPAYITQCPIQTGNSYVYDFNVTGQRGTLWWHAHILWLRATVYGAIVILPKKGIPFPFPRPDKDQVVILGEWWNKDIEEIENQGNKLGLAPNTSDAHTINGKPGPLFPCKHTFYMEVEHGKTYLLRIINAALNSELFFAIAGHNMTVVEIDAVYTKPFSTSTILISSGQTTTVLVQANQAPAKYFMAASPLIDIPFVINNKTTTAIFQYKGIYNIKNIIPPLPNLPSLNDTAFSITYNSKLKSLNSKQFPANVPLKVDRKLFYTIGFGLNPCPTCVNGTRLVASLNNISFVMPRVGLLQAHYFNLTGVYTTDFPDRPPQRFNYTGAPATGNLRTVEGTRLSKIRFNSTVEMVLQDTNLIIAESHPFHLHGYNFFVMGTGIGNFDPKKDPSKYNVVDPPERNTVGVPMGGWTAIRFRADNPGVWFMHCHLELHTGWGLKTAFLVEDGGPNRSVLPPPKDLPSC